MNPNPTSGNSDLGRSSGRAFAWRVIATTLLVSVCLGMSGFQLWRADVKAARYERLLAAQASAPVSVDAKQNEFAELELRRLKVRGHWLSDKSILLDNKIHQRRVGYNVLMPFQLEDSSTVVLVNRGWTAAPRLRSELPTIETVAGEIEITGIARRFEQRVFELKAEQSPGRVWQHVREEDYRKHSGLGQEMKVLPLLMLQTSESADGLIRDWVPPDNPSLHHIGYAVMWFIFSIMAALYGLVLWKRK